ncbi:MAG: hypothetical protein ACRYGF_16645 [Janthinobacterium lividum]
MLSDLPKTVILSRKGFDSVAGGCASPIFEDGRMFSFPIPERARHANVSTTFDSLRTDHPDEVASVLGSLKPRFDLTRKVHLDPDIRPGLRPFNFENALMYFGQNGKDQTELNMGGVSDADNNPLFLFYGWFKGIERRSDGGLRYARTVQDDARSHDQHVIWGWLQTDSAPRRITQEELTGDLMSAVHHPHIEDRHRGQNNWLYIARERLSFAHAIAGAGTFEKYAPALRLTCDLQSSRRSSWSLPSFLRNAARGRIRNAPWQTDGDRERVFYKGYGQEFLFNTEGHEKETSIWLSSIFKHASTLG